MIPIKSITFDCPSEEFESVTVEINNVLKPCFKTMKRTLAPGPHDTAYNINKVMIEADCICGETHKAFMIIETPAAIKWKYGE